MRLGNILCEFWLKKWPYSGNVFPEGRRKIINESRHRDYVIATALWNTSNKKKNI